MIILTRDAQRILHMQNRNLQLHILRTHMMQTPRFLVTMSISMTSAVMSSMAVMFLVYWDRVGHLNWNCVRDGLLHMHGNLVIDWVWLFYRDMDVLDLLVINWVGHMFNDGHFDGNMLDFLHRDMHGYFDVFNDWVWHVNMLNLLNRVWHVDVLYLLNRIRHVDVFDYWIRNVFDNRNLWTNLTKQKSV